MRKIIILLLSLILCNGCVSVTYNYQPQTIKISEPPLNTVVTAYIGDNMLNQGEYTESDAIYLKDKVHIGPFGYTFTSGYYLKKGETDKSEFYYPGGVAEPGHVIPDPMADSFQAIRIDKKSGKFCGVTVFGEEGCTSKADYERKKCIIKSSDSFQQTLIYSGKVGDKINIGYREFSNNMARPAYSNEVEYDLSESKIIGYKEARIEVIEATNEYIKYKVLQNFKSLE